MKKCIFIFFLIGCFISSFSQDLIVNHQNDSINCRINSLDDIYIFASYQIDNQIRDTVLRKDLTKVFIKNYFQKTIAINQHDTVQIENIGSAVKKSFSKIRIAVSGGYSYRTAPVSSEIQADLQDYIKDLKNGFHISGDVTYFFNRNIGAGLYYSFSQSSNKSSIMFLDETTQTVFPGTISNRISVQFVGPAFYYRQFNKKQTGAFHASTSIGYLYYHDDAVLFIPYKQTAGTVGLVEKIGFDFKISKELSFGLQLSVLLGSVKKFKENVEGNTTTKTLDNNQREGLGRIDLSIGLRFDK